MPNVITALQSTRVYSIWEKPCPSTFNTVWEIDSQLFGPVDQTIPEIFPTIIQVIQFFNMNHYFSNCLYKKFLVYRNKKVCAPVEIARYLAGDEQSTEAMWYQQHQAGKLFEGQVWIKPTGNRNIVFGHVTESPKLPLAEISPIVRGSSQQRGKEERNRHTKFVLSEASQPLNSGSMNFPAKERNICHCQVRCWM